MSPSNNIKRLIAFRGDGFTLKNVAPLSSFPWSQCAVLTTVPFGPNFGVSGRSLMYTGTVRYI